MYFVDDVVLFEFVEEIMYYLRYDLGFDCFFILVVNKIDFVWNWKVSFEGKFIFIWYLVGKREKWWWYKDVINR